jgi:hypothetical protein
VADIYLLKLQRLHDKVLRTIQNVPSYTPVRYLHMAFNIPYVHDYIKKWAAGNKQKLYKIMRMNMFVVYS